MSLNLDLAEGLATRGAYLLLLRLLRCIDGQDTRKLELVNDSPG